MLLSVAPKVDRAGIPRGRQFLMKIFFAAEQLLHDPKHEFAAGGVRLAMEGPERAPPGLAALEATALGPGAPPPDYGLEPGARGPDPNLPAFFDSAHAPGAQT